MKQSSFTLFSIVLFLTLILFPSLSYCLISGSLILFNVKLPFENIVFLVSNIWWINLVPKVLGTIGLCVLLIKNRHSVNLQVLKNRLFRLSVIGFTACLCVSVIVAEAPLANAMTVATTGYVLDTPLPIADWYIGKYSDGSYFAINGSNWDNLVAGVGSTAWSVYKNNATKLTELVLGEVTSGTVYMKEVPFDYDLTIPENVQVVENVNGVQRTFGNLANSQGSPYTITAGTGVDANNYFAEDRKGTILMTSTNGESMFLSVFNALPSTGGTIILAPNCMIPLDQTLLLQNKPDVTIMSYDWTSGFIVNDVVQSTIVGTATSGTNQLTVANGTGFVAGQDIYIGATGTNSSADHETGSDPNGLLDWCLATAGESNRIQSINGNTITLTWNLDLTYSESTPVWTIYDAITPVSCPNLKLVGLTVDGNQANQIPSGYDPKQNLIHPTNCSNIEISKCQLINGVYNSILLHPLACRGANIHDNVLTTNAVETQTRMISVEGGATATITRNFIDTTGYYGIYFVGAQNCICTHNTIYNRLTKNGVFFGSIGIGVLNGGNSTIANNIIENSHYGIFSHGTSNNHYDYNTIKNGNFTGIYMTNGGKSNYVTGNNFLDIIGTAIRLNGETNTTLALNTINLGTSGNGIYFTGNTNETYAFGNSISNIRYGFSISAGSLNNIICNNIISAFSTAAIYTQAGDTTSAKNNYFDNTFVADGTTA